MVSSAQSAEARRLEVTLLPGSTRRSQSTTWKDSIAAHMAVLAGIDFFTVEPHLARLATYYALFFVRLERRCVTLGGITKHQRKTGCCRWAATRQMRSPDF